MEGKEQSVNLRRSWLGYELDMIHVVSCHERASIIVRPYISREELYIQGKSGRGAAILFLSLHPVDKVLEDGRPASTFVETGQVDANGVHETWDEHPGVLGDGFLGVHEGDPFRPELRPFGRESEYAPGFNGFRNVEYVALRRQHVGKDEGVEGLEDVRHREVREPRFGDGLEGFHFEDAVKGHACDEFFLGKLPNDAAAELPGEHGEGELHFFF